MTRGGKRKNSGRKPGKRRKRCTVDMLPEVWAAIDQQRGTMSRGRWIESVLPRNESSGGTAKADSDPR